MAENPARRLIAGAPQGGGGFQKYAAGRKHYGGGRQMPNIGRVGSAKAAAGYNQRDAQAAARLEALKRRIGGA